MADQLHRLTETSGNFWKVKEPSRHYDFIHKADVKDIEKKIRKMRKKCVVIALVLDW